MVPVAEIFLISALRMKKLEPTRNVRYNELAVPNSRLLR